MTAATGAAIAAGCAFGFAGVLVGVIIIYACLKLGE